MKKGAAKKRKPGTKDLVYGLGATGLSIARYLQRNDVNAIYVDSRKAPPGIADLEKICPAADVVTGSPPRSLLKGLSRIIVSPGVPDSEPFLVAARKAGIATVSDVELFVHEARAPFVAVTGSNGKSTVTTLLALMCSAAGKTGLAGANLGVPALDLLQEEVPDFYILELSSFQLQRTRHLPAAVAMLLNISPDHLDWHASEDEYRRAKYRIFDQAKAAVINRADEQVRERLPAGLRCKSFGLDVPAADEFGLVGEDGQVYLARGKQLLLAVTDIAMVGVHNQANCLAALAAGELMGLHIAPMLEVLNNFPGLPHRMQAVRDIAGVRFINDSKATNVGAAIAAVSSVDGIVVLIAGGRGKGGDFEQLATATHRKLRAVLLIGEDGPLLHDAFEGLVPTEYAENLRAAVSRAADIAQTGDTVLLAPACASLDQYPNYQARGDDFRRAVEALPS